MVAVAPPAPKSQAAHGKRITKPAAGAADFKRILERTAAEKRPAPEAAPGREDNPPEAKPEAAAHGEDQAPVQTEEKKTPDQDQDQEKDPQAEHPKDRDAVPTPPATQPIVPLSPAEAAMNAAGPAQGKAEAAVPQTTGKAEVVAAPAPRSGVCPTLPAPGKAEPGAMPAAEKIEPLPAPAPESGASPLPPATGKAATSHTRTEGEQTDTPAADQLPADQQLNLETLQTKTVELPLEKSPSTDLLSFREMMHPDLKTEVSPEPVLDQLQQAMNAALLDETAQVVMPQLVRGLATLVSEGLSEMRLQLLPDDLGEIEVRVRTSEGVVRGEMMVQNPEVKQLLDQHLDRLRNALHQQGLDLQSFDIGLAPDGRFAQPDRSGHGSQSQGGERRQTSGTSPLSEAAPPVLAPRGALAVDYLA